MLRTPNFSRDLLISVCSVLLFSGIARAQILNVTDTTSTPIPGAGHDYIKMLNETVNPANGSVSIRIQTPVPPGRRLAIPFAFAYDSNGVHHPESMTNSIILWLTNQSFLSKGGWSYSVPMLSAAYEQKSYTVPYVGTTYTCSYYADYVFQDPAAGRHALGLAAVINPTSTDCLSMPGPPYSVLTGGDTVVRAKMSSYSYSPGDVYISDPDGTLYDFPNPNEAGASQTYQGLPWFVEDRNGNKITFTDLRGGKFTSVDTLGRTVVSSSGFGATGNTVSISGLSQPYTMTWGSASYNYSVGATVWEGSGCALIPALSGNQPVISAVALPNGAHYYFYYEGTYGLLNKIVYPTGGYVRYVWGMNSQSELGAFTDLYGNAGGCYERFGTPVVLHRYVSFDGSTEVLQQDFTYSTTWSSTYLAWSTKQATVTTHDLLRGLSAQTTYVYGSVSAGTPPNEVNYVANQIPVEHTITYGDWNGTTARKVTELWWDQFRLGCQQTILGSTSPTSMKLFYYAAGGQLKEKDEYDFGTACSGIPQTAPSASLLRKTAITYATFGSTPLFSSPAPIYDRPSSVITYDGSGNRLAETDYTYDGGSLGGSGVQTGRDSNFSASMNVRGNATSKSKWVTTTNTPLTWSYTYDDTGQPTDMYDPKNNHTQYSYNDNFPACSSPPGDTNAYLTEIQDAKGFTQTFAYRYCDGQLVSSTDRNSQPKSYTYADSLNRLTSISYPDGGLTTYTYGNACGEPATTAIAPNYTESATLDGICHVTRNAITSDPQGTDYTDTTYDGRGLVWKVSNPYRGTSESSYGLTTTSHDALGRVSDVGSTKSIVYPDGSPTSTTYSGQCSTVIDPANVTRTLCNDALGRLTSVNEGGLYTTSYTYNALDDLTTVTQGSQTRTFGYDSLSRLTSATNPESGTTSYTYPTSNSSPCSGDPSSPCTRTDARGITTTYAYVDPLNRLTSKTYSDGTPTANFAYDESAVTLGSWTSPGLAYPKGRLTHTTTMSGSTLQTATVQDYDKMGRTQHYWQCTPLNCGSASIWQTYYHYDLAGDSDWWTHPAGFTITNTISPARRITQVASSLSDSTHPANLAQNIVYNAAGSITGLQNGCVGSGCTQLLETYAYNKRLQMAVAELGTSTTHSADSCRVYNYYVGVANASACSESASAWPQGSNNDGDVAGYFYQDSVNSGLNHKAAYSYDGVNRLISAAATGNSTYSQAFSYDAYGNLNCTPAGPGCVALTYNTATNRITSSGYAYDAAGNLLGDGTYTYQWDAEAHLTKVYNGVMAVVSANTYNALGQRVRDVTQTTTTDEAYGAGGSLLWRYTGNSNDPNQRAFVPFQGGILAEYYSGGTLFDHPDEIGSITTASDQTGNNFQERLYYPFGESWTGANLPNLGMHQTFGKLPDYDPETDQYNTLNRHYSPSGRWLSPDPGGEKVVKLDDPQTWNLYAYVRNNPTSLTDPLGLWGADCAKDLKHCQEEKPQAPTDRTITAAAQPAQGQKEQAKPPANSRQDIVLVRAGKPQRYTALVWEIDWKIEERKGNNVESPGSKYEKSVVTLSEQVEGEKDWKSGGSGRGGFTDWISIESRTITQRFSVDSQRVQVVLRRDDQGNLVATWDVKVNVTPSGPVYSPAP